MLPTRLTPEALRTFADRLIQINDRTGFKVSSRGWCYVLEEYGLTKNQFNHAQRAINKCRTLGYLPIDFVAEEDARAFKNLVTPHQITPEQFIDRYLIYILRDLQNLYQPNWWADEPYYIQMLVEKVDLVTLFEPICKVFKIPIATAKGWSSMLQRAEYARRFAEAEASGLKCVLLYCGDHDPDGLRISEFIRSNLANLDAITWADEYPGYDPKNLIIDRFGLNYDFIDSNKLTWIDNLITGSGKNLASPMHKNFNMSYVQNYLQQIGRRKCEANALLKDPSSARELCRSAIIRYLGSDAEDRFKSKFDHVKAQMDSYRTKIGLKEILNKIL